MKSTWITTDKSLKCYVNKLYKDMYSKISFMQSLNTEIVVHIA